MEIDIAPYIKELLYKHNNLVIPGFGNFVLTYASSTIDHVQGMLHPPNKQINFDNNLVTNDGKLLALIQEKHQLGTEDAKAVINSYVSKIKAQLGQREMVEIPEVGRLYKDFENNIQFISESTNFRKESFGLPSISFYPILRAKTPTLATKAAKKTGTTPKIASATRTIRKEPASFWDKLLLNKWLPYLLLIPLVIFGTCLIYPRLTSNSADINVESRINQKPIKSETEEIEDPREDIIDRQIEESLAEEADQIDTESITVAPDQKECIVSIGVFSVKENATKLIQKVFTQGYDAYKEEFSRNGKSYTKVGVQFAYETDQELKNKLNKIKRDYPNAVIIKQ